MKNKKNKRAVLQKFTVYINEIKLLAILDTVTKDWDFETRELIGYLVFNWNEWCFNHGFYSHAPLLLAEIKTIKAVMLKQGDEKELRTKFIKEVKNDTLKNK